ncbi:phage tail protein I [Salinisphaera orenii]|uniref:Tail protein n=1 Tax=Salinisphaera orenii YIM 95161 TaxID=1051139 RepID=A0A423PQM5_9GAMM|nr:phage tail protein I [Salinisphaera halophila]ROO27877.1 tail protein [Salinisphaera halophila YIM 95161]
MSERTADRDLLPVNATPLEKRLARVCAAAQVLDVPMIRRVWSVDDCPVRLLPYLAWSYGLRVWDAGWPESVKRARIRSSIEVHRRKGTVASVRRVVESFGGDLALREAHEMEPPGTPYTFEVTLNVGGSLPQTEQFQNEILSAVDDTKPARSQYQLVAGTTSTVAVGVLAAAQAITYRRLNLTE